MIEWYFSMQKLISFIRSENAHAAAIADEEGGTGSDCWVNVARRVKVGCGQIPVSDTMTISGETVDRWIEPGNDPQFSFRAPRRLMEDARRFFRGNGLD
jgi:hypothetical protein